MALQYERAFAVLRSAQGGSGYVHLESAGGEGRVSASISGLAAPWAGHLVAVGGEYDDILLPLLSLQWKDGGQTTQEGTFPLQDGSLAAYHSLVLVDQADLSPLAWGSFGKGRIQSMARVTSALAQLFAMPEETPDLPEPEPTQEELPILTEAVLEEPQAEAELPPPCEPPVQPEEEPTDDHIMLELPAQCGRCLIKKLNDGKMLFGIPMQADALFPPPGWENAEKTEIGGDVFWAVTLG